MTYLSRSKLRVLHAVMALADARRPVTVQALSDLLGWCSPNWTWLMLHKLRDEGLVSFEVGCQGTIRPCVRFIPAAELMMVQP